MASLIRFRAGPLRPFRRLGGPGLCALLLLLATERSFAAPPQDCQMLRQMAAVDYVRMRARAEARLQPRFSELKRQVIGLGRNLMADPAFRAAHDAFVASDRALDRAGEAQAKPAQQRYAFARTQGLLELERSPALSAWMDESCVGGFDGWAKRKRAEAADPNVKLKVRFGPADQLERSCRLKSDPSVSVEILSINPDAIEICEADEEFTPLIPARPGAGSADAEYSARLRACAQVELATGRTFRLELERLERRYRPGFAESTRLEYGYGPGRGFGNVNWSPTWINYNLPAECVVQVGEHPDDDFGSDYPRDPAFVSMLRARPAVAEDSLRIGQNLLDSLAARARPKAAGRGENPLSKLLGGSAR